MNKEKIIRLFYISIFTIIFLVLFFYPRIQNSKIAIPIYNKVLDSLVYEYATQCFPKEQLFFGTKQIVYNDCRGEFSEIEINGKKWKIKRVNKSSNESWKNWSDSRTAIKEFNLTNKNFHWKVYDKIPQDQIVEQISNVIVIILFIFSLMGVWFTRKYSICFVDYFNKLIKIIFKRI
jgi:hypothetical protein